MDFIEFRDGTTISSTNEIVNSINEGEVFGDFTSFNTTISTSRSQMELFSGSFTYNYTHNIATSGNQWKIIEFKELDTLPILSDGSGVDMSESKLIKRGGLPECPIVFGSKRQNIRRKSVFLSNIKNKCERNFPYQNVRSFL